MKKAFKVLIHGLKSFAESKLSKLRITLTHDKFVSIVFIGAECHAQAVEPLAVAIERLVP